jgi:NAD(P)H dehydrogenase (quinone)
MAKLAVVYYSSTGTIEQLARAIARGGEQEGAEVRLRRVAEHSCGCAAIEPPAETLATPGDLDWADALVLGTPASFGNVAAPLKRFIDDALPLWRMGRLSDKVVAGFTSAASLHGGHETTLLSLYNSVYHWGGIIASAGYVDPAFRAAGGNPYGLSAAAHRSGNLAEVEVNAARALGARVALLARRLAHDATEVVA